ncbi:hypothetical protein PsYK624_030970 [Phanerochaete sordida]|uniref:Uncharacterized protein n=1 Tax=Phanerochaete sordida TaxID=48140 RepID=A0A9P3G356_9APHY|nr:hypothetical protein PsYK624_030970 [Phanerochaete sordida]
MRISRISQLTVRVRPRGLEITLMAPVWTQGVGRAAHARAALCPWRAPERVRGVQRAPLLPVSALPRPGEHPPVGRRLPGACCTGLARCARGLRLRLPLGLEHAQHGAHERSQTALACSSSKLSRLARRQLRQTRARQAASPSPRLLPRPPGVRGAGGARGAEMHGRASPGRCGAQRGHLRAYCGAGASCGCRGVENQACGAPCPCPCPARASAGVAQRGAGGRYEPGSRHCYRCRRASAADAIAASTQGEVGGVPRCAASAAGLPQTRTPRNGLLHQTYRPAPSLCVRAVIRVALHVVFRAALGRLPSSRQGSDMRGRICGMDAGAPRGVRS